MNRQLLNLFVMCLSATPLLADTSSSFQTASSSYVGFHESLKSVRDINGGTVIKALYSEDIPYEMRSAFDYACKLWEEAMPNSLPISIQVSTDNISRSSRTILSKVSMTNYKNLGQAPGTTPSSVLKHMILGEYESSVNYTFYDYIHDVSLIDTITPDITIVYNKNMLEQMSFSIEDEITDKYDFVTVALRDIAKGLGMMCNFAVSTANPTCFSRIPTDPSPFERTIISEIGGTDSNAFKKATSGSVNLLDGFTLYAPSPWQVGNSLQTTIPSEKIGLSRLMDYNFGKGFAMRNFSDHNLLDVFTYALGYQCAIPTGASDISSAKGSTSSFMPFSKDAKFPTESMKQCTEVATSNRNASSPTKIDENNIDNFLKKFSAHSNMVQILKQDGTWDTVKYLGYDYNGPEDNISDLSYKDLEFHYPASKYARTADGYLRGRKVTTSVKSMLGHTYNSISSWYFVIDCLPQIVKLKAHNDKSASPNTGEASTYGIPIGGGGTDLPIYSNSVVSIGMKNLEGITQLVLEVLPNNSKVPVRMFVPNPKDGVFDLDLRDASSAIVTPISYNANGSTRGESITVSKLLFTVIPSPSFNKTENEIRITSEQDVPTPFPYEIVNMTDGSIATYGFAKLNSSISIGSLSPGLYSLKYHMTSDCSKEYKFMIN